ncbi:hypothetical protein LR48_Vigan05g073300 [Vigna angularis]|uniref:Uncharacterized protein n=1 Tax=Phaseolus angularis TaxID=3914 RepID=A0A0L9UKP3_PHAAN|nr:hypothetical protein LR48_Vigan05g073300 [Vigna angularis]
MAADALTDNSLPASSDSGIKVIVRMRPFSLMGFSSSSPSSRFEFANVGGTRRRQRYFGWRLVVEQGGVLSFLILGSFTHGGEAIWRHRDHGKASPRRKGVSRQSIFASPLFVQVWGLQYCWRRDLKVPDTLKVCVVAMIGHFEKSRVDAGAQSAFLQKERKCSKKPEVTVVIIYLWILEDKLTARTKADHFCTLGVTDRSETTIL